MQHKKKFIKTLWKTSGCVKISFDKYVNKMQEQKHMPVQIIWLKIQK